MSARERSQPRIIILGCGYLGRALAESSVADGWTVEALTRNIEKAERLRRDLGIGVIEGDLASDGWHEALDPEGAWVIDCVSSGGGGLAGYRHAYHDGAESIVRWLRGRATPLGLIYTGSTSVYPQGGGSWVDEGSPTAGSTSLNEVLLATESVFFRSVAEGAFPRVALLRLAGIYGPGRHHLIDRLRAGERDFPGRGDYFLNLIHRDDAVRAIVHLVERWNGAGAEVFNCADGCPALKEEIVEWTAEQLKVARPVFHPDQLSDRAKRRVLASGSVPNRRIRADKLRAVAGWAPRYTDYRAGYAELLGAMSGER